jgi:hypothetical protein
MGAAQQAAVTPIVPHVSQRTGEVTDLNWDELTQERAALAATVAQLQERITQIDDLYREHLEFGVHEFGGLKVSVQHNRRLDTKKVTAAYPVAQRPELYRPAIDTTELKRHIAAIELEAFYNESTPRVVVA